MEKTMQELKVIATINKIPQWKIAETIGIHPSNLCVWMRKYNAEHYDKILKAMKKINPEGVEKTLKFLEGM